MFLLKHVKFNRIMLKKYNIKEKCHDSKIDFY